MTLAYYNPRIACNFQKLHSKQLRIICSTFLCALNSQLFGYFFEMKIKQSRKDLNIDKTTALDNVTNELECSCLQPHAFNSSTLGPSANCNQVCSYVLKTFKRKFINQFHKASNTENKNFHMKLFQSFKVY